MRRGEKRVGAEEKIKKLCSACSADHNPVYLAGLGNWAEVALVVGTKKKIECEFHYYANYINTGNGIPVPDVSRAISKTKALRFNAKSTKDDYSECIEAAVAGAGKASPSCFFSSLSYCELSLLLPIPC
eukprot:767837-Hanusia_phi.AAC.3